MSNRPNILCIVTDQQHPDLLGCADRFPVKTPNLDALAAGGARFERAYTASPTCTPTRATLVTGQYPSRHGAWNIGTNLPDGALSLPEQLKKQAGYRTAIIGKSHLQSCSANGSFEAPPNSENWEFFEKWTGPWYGFEYAKINIGHTSEPHSYSMHYGAYLNKHGINREEPWFTFTESPNDRTSKWEFPLEHHQSTWVTNETIDYIRQGEGKKEPFYVSMNFADPHVPFRVPEPYYSMYDGVELPPTKRIEGEDNGTTLYRATRGRSYGENGIHAGPGLPCMGANEEQPLERNEYEERVWRTYMGMQTLIDDQVGRVIDYLKESGQFENTLIIFTTDHGDYMGEHHLWSKGGCNYDGAVRVPFIASWPEQIPAGTVTDQLLSLVDLPATFMSAAGLEPHELMQGRDQIPTFTDPNISSRDGVLIENRIESTITVTSWITKQHRLSVHNIHALGKDELELYDFEEDPNEFSNVAADQPDTVNHLFGEMLRYKDSVSGPWNPRPTFA